MTLEHLDTIIAFAAIMAGVSLFVTTLTQMSSALLGLRGCNLKWGLQVLLQNLEPALKDHAEAISEEVLRHPLISDSMFFKWTHWMLDLPIIRNWKDATAIRVEELIGILKKLTAGLPLDGAGTAFLDQAILVLKDLAAGPLDAAAFQTKLRQTSAALDQLSRLLPDGSPWKDKLAELQRVLAVSQTPDATAAHRLKFVAGVLHDLAGKIRLAATLKRLEETETTRATARLAEFEKFAGSMSSPEARDELRRLLPRLTAKAGRATVETERLFNSTMDRVSQHFTMHMRIWTVLFSIFIAASLQLDAPELLTRLSSDAELRARLVSSAEAITQKADELRAASADASSSAYVEAMKELKASHSDALGQIDDPAAITNSAGASQWLRSQLSAHQLAAATNEPVVRSWLTEYERLVPQASLRSAAGNLQSLLKEKLTLQLVPDPYPCSLGEFARRLRLHVWGILVSAAFLSLGAPFWFNLLKTLSNLRPNVAAKQEKEADAAAQP